MTGLKVKLTKHLIKCRQFHRLTRLLFGWQWVFVAILIITAGCSANQERHREATEPESEINESKPPPVPTPASVPQLPVIRLSYGGRVHDGLLRSYCWPTTESPKVALCGESEFQGPSTAIPVAAGSTSLTSKGQSKGRTGRRVRRYVEIRREPSA